jgi:hypothetical protein
MADSGGRFYPGRPVRHPVARIAYLRMAGLRHKLLNSAASRAHSGLDRENPGAIATRTARLVIKPPYGSCLAHLRTRRAGNKAAIRHFGSGLQHTIHRAWSVSKNYLRIGMSKNIQSRIVPLV